MAFFISILRTEGIPDAVAVGQRVQTAVRAAYRALVERNTGAQLQRLAVLVRRAEGGFVSVAPVRRDNRAVGAAVDDGFGVFKHQLGTVETAVARPSQVGEQVGFIGCAIHAVQRQGFRRYDFDAGLLVRLVAERGADKRIVGTLSAECRMGRCYRPAVGLPIGRAFQVVIDFRAVVHTDAGTRIDVPQPAQLVAEAPVFAFDFRMAV